MKPHLIILGAGATRGAGRPFGLQRVTHEGRVLDWQLEAFRGLAPEVSFVGGYDIGSVIHDYPNLTYHYNARWDETGAAASLCVALEALDDLSAGQRDLYVAYADILIRAELVAAMAEDMRVGCFAAWDALHPGMQSRVPESITIDGADREFVGLLRVPARSVPAFRQALLANRADLGRIHMAHMLERMAPVLPPVMGVLATGRWAHAEQGRSVARFVLGSKASTLDRLRTRLTQSRILDLEYFTRAEWAAQRDRVTARLLERLGTGSALIVRSSATDEDGFERANAGRYHSELDVAPRREALSQAIDRVFASYASNDARDEVLVQPQLADVVASGVVFTRTLHTGAPYWVVNYTEGSDTTAITSGVSRESVRLYVSRAATGEALDALSPTARTVLLAVREIEDIVCHDALDIEFAMDSRGRVFTLQVRPLMVDDQHQDREGDAEVFDCLAGVQRTVAALGVAPAGQCGDFCAWSVMADWNPAEIVGLVPGPLALDLYRYVITDQVWARQRADVGYRDLRGWPLVRSFGGQAFVDVRASVNSFIPAELNEEIASAIANTAIERLKADLSLHDKVEFELVPTCLDLDFGVWRDRYTSTTRLTREQVNEIEAALGRITRRIVERSNGGVAAAAALEQRCAALEQRRAPFADWLRGVLDECSNGALHFAHLARAGFVAAALLRSAVRRGVLTESRRAELMESIPGVGHMFTESAAQVRAGLLERSAFIARFGHLRPGTYDIGTPPYRARPEAYIDPVIEATHRADERAAFDWTVAERQSLADELSKVDIGLDADSFLEFVRTAVAGREYAKFVFTRLLSAALDALAIEGRANGISENRLASMPLSVWLSRSTLDWGDLNARQELLASVEIRERQRRLAARMVLPPVICDPREVVAFAVPPSEPTFITNRRAAAALRRVAAGEVVRREDVQGRVVAVANADPGFDYLFALGIAGLITAYGGPNSHMAIRASEFAIPAVIGVGERAFEALRDGLLTELDGQRRMLRQDGDVCAS